jgi:hypothetical protein
MKELTKEQTDFLKKLYYEDNIKVGIVKLYKYIKDKYPEQKITREQVGHFLSLQEPHQINQSIKKIKHIKSIKAKNRFELVQIDLIDYSQNTAPQGNKYILMIVDVFTRYLYAYALKQKNAEKVLEKFKLFYETIKNDDYEIKRLQSDAGGEFKGIFTEYLKDNNIIYIQNSQSQANGIVERTNKTIKTLIERTLQDKTNKKNQFTILPDVVEIYNNTYHSSIKTTPYNAMFKNDEDNTIKLRQVHKERIKKNEDKQKIGQVSTINMNKNIKIGDGVRIAKLRKGLTKSFVDNWSGDIYEVAKIIKARKPGQPDKYKLLDWNNNILPKLYYREQLQVVKTEEDMEAEKNKK